MSSYIYIFLDELHTIRRLMKIFSLLLSIFPLSLSVEKSINLWTTTKQLGLDKIW